MKQNLWLHSIVLLVLSGAIVSCSAVNSTPVSTPTPTLSPTFQNTATPTPLPTKTSTPQPTATSTPLPTATTTSLPTVTSTQDLVEFDGERAFQDVDQQVAFGPRLPGSQAHAQTVDWIKQELINSGWVVEMQETTYQNQPVRNIIAKQGEGKSPWVIIGAHYDSRMKADRDPNPENQDKPVPGANDGASGAAVLLELARVLPKDLEKQVWLVFIDAEDQGDLPGWDWILGSRAFAESLTTNPDAVVIIDMIGDANLNIPKERFSSPDLVSEIWDVAAQRGHIEFLPQDGYAMLDDHTPFLQKGVRAIDIIDFDYNYWHTTADTPDKVSPASLYAVGDTLLHWLTGRK